MSENDINAQENENSSENLSELLQIRRDKLKKLQDEGKDPFHKLKYEVTNHTDEIINNFEKYEGKVISLAGRLMSKRIMGKASFSDVQDRNGRIQLYIARDILGEEVYTEYKHMDIGDIIGITGEVFKTHKEEISVRVSNMELLSKSLQILPEKYHGLKDTDLRYRNRHLDLIVNPEIKDAFMKRSKIISNIRKVLDEKGFLEVETPILQVIPGGAEARPFVTHHNSLDIDMYLRIALELYLKRLIVGGMERVYEIGRVFRNEGMSVKHNPEFTMIELYQAFTDLRGMMELTEELIRTSCEVANETLKITYQGVEIDLSRPFAREPMTELVKKYSGVDFNDVKTDEEAKKLAKEHHVEFEDYHKRGEIISLFFEEFVEEKLVQPTFVTDYPIEISPLCKKKLGSDTVTDRFELFIAGREYANAYSELNDPIDQRERFLYQESLRAQGDDEASRIDEEFLSALEYGMPPTGGMGMGIDRLVMLLTDSASIRDILFFPTMKPLNK